MATPTQTLAVTCPNCAAHFRVAGEMAGRKGQCARCQAVFRVPATAAAPTKPTAPKSSSSAPRYVSVNCRVCQTRLSGLLEHVGKPLKCPDCGAQTILPPPPVEKQASARPAAMDGEQYELWGVDEAPSVAEMLAAQPKYIAVECRMCQTLMHATPDQVGQPLKCPDCGTANVVPPPAEPRKKKDVLAPSEFDLDIDPDLDPGERPAVNIPPRRPMLYEEEQQAEEKRQEERKARGDARGPQYDDRGRPVMPRWPTLTRILPFLVSNGIPVRWLVLSAVAYLVLFFLALGGLAGHPLAAVPLAVIALILATVWAMALSAVVMTIIVESSEGNDEVPNWPANSPGDWVGEFLYMLFAFLVGPVPGWLLGRYVVQDQAATAALFAGSLLLALPLVLLSQLDTGSAFGVASPRVIASLFRCPLSWVLFYVEVALVAGVCFGTILLLEAISPKLGYAAIPIFIGGLFLAARILGRLAWKLAETMSESE